MKSLHRPNEWLKSTKSVGYAYPTSPNAEKFGFGSAGCYCVMITEIKGGAMKPPKAVAAYRTKAEALVHAEMLPEPWNQASL